MSKKKLLAPACIYNLFIYLKTSFMKFEANGRVKMSVLDTHKKRIAMKWTIHISSKHKLIHIDKKRLELFFSYIVEAHYISDLFTWLAQHAKHGQTSQFRIIKHIK